MSEENSVIVREVRDRAVKIDERFDHDIHKYCEYLRQQEQRHPDRVVSQITVVSAGRQS
jgi:hypothetical protein